MAERANQTSLLIVGHPCGSIYLEFSISKEKKQISSQKSTSTLEYIRHYVREYIKKQKKKKMRRRGKTSMTFQFLGLK